MMLIWPNVFEKFENNIWKVIAPLLVLNLLNGLIFIYISLKTFIAETNRVQVEVKK
jgi:hypothetical protein